MNVQIAAPSISRSATLFGRARLGYCVLAVEDLDLGFVQRRGSDKKNDAGAHRFDSCLL